MTLDQWRADPKLAQWAAQVFSSPNGQLLMAMLEDSHIRKAQLPPIASDSVKATELGRIYGYDIALNNIEAACKLITPTAALVETFGISTESDKKKK